MRLFVALDIDDMIRARIQGFVEEVARFASTARWVQADSLHITVKFIGERPLDMAERIKQQLAVVKAGEIEIAFRGYGFFPTARAARVFWVGMSSTPQLASLAKAVDDAAAQLGIERETRAFSPHLTLARSGSGAPGKLKGDRENNNFRPLREKLEGAEPPEFGIMKVREFFLYQSQPVPEGTCYTKIARFGLSC
jgi:2'-5' RNA ligase